LTDRIKSAQNAAHSTASIKSGHFARAAGSLLRAFQNRYESEFDRTRAGEKVHRRNVCERCRIRSLASPLPCFVGDKWKDSAAEFAIISMRARGPHFEGIWHPAGVKAGRSYLNRRLWSGHWRGEAQLTRAKRVSRRCGIHVLVCLIDLVVRRFGTRLSATVWQLQP